jgi:hypothetical protein
MPMMDRSAAKLQLAWMRGQYMLRMLDLTQSHRMMRLRQLRIDVCA